MAAVERVSAILAQRLEKAKENLEDVEQNIRKLSGGESTERRVSDDVDSRRLVVGELRRVTGDQRRVSGDQRRLSGDQRRVAGDQRRLFSDLRRLGDQKIERRLSGEQRRLTSDLRGLSGDQRRVSLDEPALLGRGRGLTVQRLTLMERLGAPPAKRANLGSPFSRLGGRVGQRNRAPSDDEEDELDHKPLVQSSVVTTLTTLTPKSRQETIKEGQKDKRSVDRNKRMFGHLLGTLQKFRDESDTKTDKDKRRKEIEKKLEEKAIEEKKAVAEERKLLMKERKDKQAELNRLEQLVELTEEHKDWDAHSILLSNFIRTKAKPHIFYKPAKWTLGTEKLFKESKQILSAGVEKRKLELEKEIAKLEGKQSRDDEKKEDHQSEDSKKDRRRSGGEDRRRSGEERRRRHSNRDEVKGKKEDRDRSNREDEKKHGSDDKRRDRKRTRHDDKKEPKNDKESKDDNPKDNDPNDTAKPDDEQSSKDKVEESEKEKTEETVPDHDEKEDDGDGNDGKMEGKYEEEEKMEEEEEEVKENGEDNKGDKEEKGKEEGVQGLADEEWGNVGWGDEEEKPATTNTASEQVDDAQNEQEQLDYIYDDL